MLVPQYGSTTTDCVGEPLKKIYDPVPTRNSAGAVYTLARLADMDPEELCKQFPLQNAWWNEAIKKYSHRIFIRITVSVGIG